MIDVIITGIRGTGPTFIKAYAWEIDWLVRWAQRNGFGIELFNNGETEATS